MLACLLFFFSGGEDLVKLGFLPLGAAGTVTYNLQVLDVFVVMYPRVWNLGLET